MSIQVKKKCFVCNEEFDQNELFINKITSLPVCKNCKGSPEEKKAEQDALDSLAEGFVCGCI